MRKNSVKIYIKEGNMNFYSWALIADGFLFSPSVAKYIGKSLQAAVLIAEKDNGDWGIEEKHWNELGKLLNKKIENGRLSLDKLVSQHIKIGERLLVSSDQIIGKDLKKFGNTDFIKWFIPNWTDILELNGLGFAPVISDFEHNYLSKKLLSILEKKETDALQIQSHLSLLVSADRPDLNWREMLDLFTLIKRYKTIKSLKNSKDLNNHTDKYCWINFGYIGPIWTKKDFINNAKKVLENPISVFGQYSQHENHFHDLRKAQKRLEEVLKLNKQEKALFKTARVFMFCKAYRVNVRHKIQYASELIFAELSRRHKLNINTFRYATRKEIMDFLSGQKIDLKKIASRRSGMVEITEKGEKKIASLKQSKKLLLEILIKEKLIQSNQVTGQAAFLGHAQGKAKIIYEPQDMTKVNKGDILFAITTTPDLLPAMYKAAAFVTDQGGITSHAAIVAREMKKPCVIGTKIATKIFKDGDLVEVDANKGIVRLVSSKKLENESRQVRKI